MTLTLKSIVPLLQVFDMPEALKFYRDALGFSVADSSGKGDDVDWILLKKDNIELMLNTAYEKGSRPDKADGNRVASHADTTFYFGCPDIDGAYKLLVQKGIHVAKPQITGYGWKALNLTDPDGYQLCLQWPLENA